MIVEQTSLEIFNARFGSETYTYDNNKPEIKKLCPECNRKSLACNLETGLFHCWQCEYKGRILCTNITFLESRLI